MEQGLPRGDKACIPQVLILGLHWPSGATLACKPSSWGFPGLHLVLKLDTFVLKLTVILHVRHQDHLEFARLVLA